MKIIFLDIDGVLNKSLSIGERAPSGVKGIENELIKNLAYVIDKTGAKIVLVSTWKDLWDKEENKCDKDGIYLNKKFKDYNLEIFDKTDTSNFKDRGIGIKKFLDENKVENYIILDDIEYADYSQYNLLDNFLKIDKKRGFDENYANDCIKRLI